MSPMRDRLSAVRALLEACARLVERRATFAPAIVEATGLSPAGVELALTRHLEIDATDADLEKLVDGAGRADRVGVVLASNVFVGALRAIALARATAPSVVVRPSRRDPTFARLLVEELGDPALVLDDALDVGAFEGELHVYGSDATIADIRGRARGRVVGHGHGLGVAWISAHAALDAAARALAADVVVFDQRGCLSPRIALVEGALARADAFAERLHGELERAIPRGVVPAEERAAADRYVATMTYACRVLVGNEHAIGVAPPGAPLVLPPPYRHVHVAAAAREDVAARLAPLGRSVIAVGTDDPSIAPPWARVSPLGEMQRPPLDGPVDRRAGR